MRSILTRFGFPLNGFQLRGIVRSTVHSVHYTLRTEYLLAVCSSVLYDGIVYKWVTIDLYDRVQMYSTGLYSTGLYPNDTVLRARTTREKMA